MQKVIKFGARHTYSMESHQWYFGNGLGKWQKQKDSWGELSQEETKNKSIITDVSISKFWKKIFKKKIQV